MVYIMQHALVIAIFSLVSPLSLSLSLSLIHALHFQMESGVADLQKKKDGLEVDFGAAEVEDEAHVVPYFRLSQLLVRARASVQFSPSCVFAIFGGANTGVAYTLDKSKYRACLYFRLKK